MDRGPRIEDRVDGTESVRGEEDTRAEAIWRGVIGGGQGHSDAHIGRRAKRELSRALCACTTDCGACGVVDGALVCSLFYYSKGRTKNLDQRWSDGSQI